MPVKIAIVGTGLIGGSIGLAIKQARLNFEIVGHDKDLLIARKARQRGAVDKVEWNLISAVEGAALVILAIPVVAIKPTLEAIATALLPDCIVTDTAATKREVLAWADAILPAGVSFVGGHPFTGKKASTGEGIDAADVNLFQNVPYCVVPSPRAETRAVESVTGLINAIGAKPYFLDPNEHDSYVAAVEHLPLILAAALVSTTTSAPVWRDMSRLAAGAYRVVSGLADSDPDENRAICATNQDSLIHWIDACIANLQGWREQIQAGGDPLKASFEAVRLARAKWLVSSSDEEGSVIPTAVPGLSMGDQMRQLLTGIRLPRDQR